VAAGRKGRPLRVLAVAGTRPEAVKLAPVVAALRRDKAFRVRFLATGQHRRLFDGALAAFRLRPDADLRLMRPGQSPAAFLSLALGALDRELAARPADLVLVQGDTASAAAAALAAFHRRTPVAHVEAGLRSHDLAAPYPEELNRVAIDRVASIHLAPTRSAKKNLLDEGRAASGIYVTGNTVVDALLKIRRPGREKKGPRRRAVLTLHRRESHGSVLSGLLGAVVSAAKRLPDVGWLCPVHPNPEVRKAYSTLAKTETFRLCEPLPYLDFVRALSQADFIVTDSGGIQEEAPTLGLRYVVLRKVTERPEALGKWGVLAGVEPKAVERAILKVASLPRPKPGENPFGDGKAAARTVAAVKHWARLGPRPADFR
jgi:UDP-N-acetylglucosamine 2-epimerase (non-hydrolysing)